MNISAIATIMRGPVALAKNRYMHIRWDETTHSGAKIFKIEGKYPEAT